MSGLQDRIEGTVRRWLNDNRAAGIGLLQELVRTRSYSGHEGLPGRPTSVVGRLAAEAARHGTETHVQEVGPDGANLIERVRGEGTRALVVDAHTDIVPEGDHGLWLSCGPFAGALGEVTFLGGRRVAITVGDERAEAEVRERMARVWHRRARPTRRIVYGRGAFDNKGSVVAGSLALGALAAALSEHDAALGGDLVCSFSAGEETGQTGIRAFAEGPGSWLARHGYLDRERDARGRLRDVFGIALEGSYGWVPVVGHRAVVQMRLSVRARSTHAATPELGISAVEQMARLIAVLSDHRAELERRLLAHLEPSLLGPPTVAIGTTIVGGGVRSVTTEAGGVSVERSGVNVVPNWCEATLDARVPPLAAGANHSLPELVVGEVERLLAEHVEPRGWSYSVSLLPGGYVPHASLGTTLEEAESHPLIACARARAAQHLGWEPHLETAPGGTNATFFIAAGIPSLVEIGPGGGLSHDVHEFVEADDVVDGAAVLALTALDVLGVTA